MHTQWRHKLQGFAFKEVVWIDAENKTVLIDNAKVFKDNWREIVSMMIFLSCVGPASLFEF